MTTRITAVTVSCDWPGCVTSVTVDPSAALGGSYLEDRFSGRVLAGRAGWATDRPNTTTTSRGRQDFCPAHREQAHEVRMRRLGLEPTV